MFGRRKRTSPFSAPRPRRRPPSGLGSLGGLGRPPRRPRRLRLLPLLLFAAFAVYYVIANRGTVPLTGRTQLVALSPEQEVALGLESYRQILASTRIVPDGPLVETVRDVGRRLAAVAEGPRFDWEFTVIDSADVNAFCLPGGKVAVHTGLAPVTGTPEGLAIVLGHEIAHAIARHGAERIAQQQLVQLGMLAAGSALADMDLQTRRMVMGALGVGSQLGVLLPFSREHESEADHMGLIYVARACFDPTEAPRLWARMAEAGNGAPPEFLSTHPSHATRIADFESWMPEALELRRRHCTPAPAQSSTASSTGTVANASSVETTTTPATLSGERS